MFRFARTLFPLKARKFCAICSFCACHFYKAELSLRAGSFYW